MQLSSTKPVCQIFNTLFSFWDSKMPRQEHTVRGHFTVWKHHLDQRIKLRLENILTQGYKLHPTESHCTLKLQEVLAPGITKAVLNPWTGCKQHLCEASGSPELIHKTAFCCSWWCINIDAQWETWRQGGCEAAPHRRGNRSCGE